MSGFDINHTTISGNLTREPELRTPNGTQPVCSIRIAHNERYKNNSGDWADRAQYFDVTIWGGLGEWVAGNVASGDKVVVAGRLRWREWGEDGAKRQAVDITAASIIPIAHHEGRGPRRAGRRRRPRAGPGSRLTATAVARPDPRGGPPRRASER